MKFPAWDHPYRIFHIRRMCRLHYRVIRSPYCDNLPRKLYVEWGSYFQKYLGQVPGTTGHYSEQPLSLTHHEVLIMLQTCPVFPFNEGCLTFIYIHVLFLGGNNISYLDINFLQNGAFYFILLLGMIFQMLFGSFATLTDQITLV